MEISIMLEKYLIWHWHPWKAFQWYITVSLNVNAHLCVKLGCYFLRKRKIIFKYIVGIIFMIWKKNLS